MSDAISELLKLSNEMEQLKLDYKTRMKGFFEEAISSLFEVIPDLGSLVWVQYTPFFNDGEPCEFGVHDVYAYTTKYSFSSDNLDNDVFYGEGEGQIQTSKPGDWVYKSAEEGRDWAVEQLKHYEEAKNKFTESQFELIAKVTSFINSNEDLMYEVFGDHVQVIINKDGASAEEYDHD